VFYAWWDWRFLSLILYSSLIDYFVAFRISLIQNDRKRKLWLMVSLITNLGLLGFFKYYNFFVDSFVTTFPAMTEWIGLRTLNLILPVGISFYTFQSLSYTIDVYRRDTEPAKNIITFLSFVSFFPQLAAGPIERAKNMLWQFSQNRKFEYNKSAEGIKLILWGLFKKVVVADNCAVIVDDIFNNYQDFHGFTLFMGAFLFAFQIYCDFSGYSDMAIGIGKLFGINLMKNFNLPYFSKDINEFWKKWHISLTTWFRNYVYYPLGGNRVSKLKQSRNVLITFTVSGLWHGANWTFIIWGFLNGLCYLPSIFFKNLRLNFAFGKVNSAIKMGSTFLIVLLGWIFFRSDNFQDAINYINEILIDFEFSASLHQILGGENKFVFLMSLSYVFLLLFIEWNQRHKEHPLDFSRFTSLLRGSIYIILAILILFNYSDKRSFIYFQF